MHEYFRIIQRKHESTPLAFGSGGARWNPKGVPLIYAGSHCSLVILEFLCIKGSSVMSSEWSLLSLSIKSEPSVIDVKTLPIDWDVKPYPGTTQDIGRGWVKENTSVCLKVPSIRIPLNVFPNEHSLLINPMHPDFLKEVEVKNVDLLSFNLNDWA
ncbi:MAG TPA: RES domain-containing protein, partial [Chitinophagaceae bacterium]|nr:RES domain-containing protein [Chitinophagaceae bacterium]